jgi:hypothetical protein
MESGDDKPSDMGHVGHEDRPHSPGDFAKIVYSMVRRRYPGDDHSGSGSCRPDLVIIDSWGFLHGIGDNDDPPEKLWETPSRDGRGDHAKIGVQASSHRNRPTCWPGFLNEAVIVCSAPNTSARLRASSLITSTLRHPPNIVAPGLLRILVRRAPLGFHHCGRGEILRRDQLQATLLPFFLSRDDPKDLRICFLERAHGSFQS